MKRIITYGTFDLFHEGHVNILRRAKELGDYLIVGVTTKTFDYYRGKLNVQQELMERIENVKASGLADEIIIEEYEGQKIDDIIKYNVDIFAIGSDWINKFDYLNEYCEVVYLERTKGVSSTQLRDKTNGILKLGIVGNGDMANIFINESKFVSGLNVEGVYGSDVNLLKHFVEKHKLAFYTTNYDTLLINVDAVYISSNNFAYFEFIKKALEKGKHVLCEKIITLSHSETSELYTLAKMRSCVLLEGIITAYTPGFIRMVSIAKTGLIGTIKNIDASITKLVGFKDIKPNNKEKKEEKIDIDDVGGSMIELAPYPLIAVLKLLGENVEGVNFYSFYDKEKKRDLFTKINLRYSEAIATVKVGLGVKLEDDLIISGTKGYVYVPSPWWKTEYFEIRFEDNSNNKKYYFKFDGDGLRYEIAEFISLINKKNTETYKLTPSESIFISNIIEVFIKGDNVQLI